MSHGTEEKTRATVNSFEIKDHCFNSPTVVNDVVNRVRSAAVEYANDKTDVGKLCRVNNYNGAKI